jgi:hypothetical protein
MECKRLALLIALAASAVGIAAKPRPRASCTSAPLGEIRVERIATWRDDARGAYSIVHDNVCAPQFSGILEVAVPALDKRGLKAGLAAVVSDCDGLALWPRLKSAAERGHEIVSQSTTHATVTPENAAREVEGAKKALERGTGAPVDFYAFPYDKFTPETIALVEKAGYKGARAGARNDFDGQRNPPVNPADPTNDFTVVFDVWPRLYSKYTLYDGADLLNVHVWDAIEKGGWAMRELYSIRLEGDAPEAPGFGAVPLDVYEKHLDFLVEARRASYVWVDTPRAILSYRRARKACGVSAAGHRLTFDVSKPDCARFATPLSVVVTARADLPQITARQRGETVPVRPLGGGRFVVTADPTHGDVLLSGCAETAPGAATTAALPTRPKAAESVCELGRRVGAGDWWPIDDFERDELEFQAHELPLWTIYPESAEIKRVKEGSGAFMRFSGQALQAWSGASYMFTGREGAGICYDVNAHKGIRFKIRGTVVSGDEFANKVFLSLLTSETRARIYGGDLEGSGGHFNLVLDLTADWRQVEVPWSSFARPTWGDTARLEKPALNKVQGFDWAIAGTAARFEVDLEDVELY